MFGCERNVAKRIIAFHCRSDGHKICRMAENSSHYATCHCQQCSGGIEFDTSGFALEETQLIECPHCKMETLLYVPKSTVGFQSKPKSASRPDVASPKTALFLWMITALMFFVFLQTATEFFGFIFGGFLSAAAISTIIYQNKKRELNPPKPNYICTNCGSLLVCESIGGPKENYVCSECQKSSAVPLGTPRGQELYATYHGKISAKARVEIGDEANRRLLFILEPGAASGGIAAQLEKLAGLVRTGAITHDEWQRAKNLYLDQPQNKREQALARIQQLFDLQRQGALSDSEFNSVKWDILSRGVV